MTIAYWCILIMIIFPYIFITMAKISPTFNNRDPRTYLENLTGWRKRAYYIQLNSFEMTPAFAIAIIVASLVAAPQSNIDRLAIIFVISRVCYASCYLLDKPRLRSFCWAIGMVCVIGLFFLR